MIACDAKPLCSPKPVAPFSNSPNSDAFFGWQPEFVTFFHFECFVELGQVSDYTVASELRRRVRINRQSAAQLRVTEFRTPDLSPTDEQPLGAG
jgi:hypothetical protein